MNHSANDTIVVQGNFDAQTSTFHSPKPFAFQASGFPHFIRPFFKTLAVKALVLLREINYFHGLFSSSLFHRSLGYLPSERQIRKLRTK